MEGVSIERAYDPEKADKQQRCWLNELMNPAPHDWQGLQEFACLNKVPNNSNFLASYKQKCGPSLQVCGSDHFGVVQDCDPRKPWLEPLHALRCDRHTQLEDVMGLNVRKGRQPAFSKRMADCSEPVRQAPDVVDLSCLCKQGACQCYKEKQGGCGCKMRQGASKSSRSKFSDLVWVLILIVFLGALVAAGYFFLRR